MGSAGQRRELSVPSDGLLGYSDAESQEFLGDFDADEDEPLQAASRWSRRRAWLGLVTVVMAIAMYIAAQACGSSGTFSGEVGAPAGGAGLRSLELSAARAEEQVVGISWVGCFMSDPVGAGESLQVGLHGPDTSGYNTEECSRECKGHAFMGLQNGGRCLCGDSYASDPQTQQVYDGLCGNLCPKEGELAPPRYCGAESRNAVYRLSVLDPPSEKASTGEVHDQPGKAVGRPADLVGSLLGTWLFGEEETKCQISKAQDGKELRFAVPLLKGQLATGNLQQQGEWLVAELSSTLGERVGVIRLRTLSDGTVISNFKYTGETAWGKDTMAHKQGSGSHVADAPKAAAPKAEVGLWVVVTENGLNVRGDKDRTAIVLATKTAGAMVQGRQDGEWLALTNEPGFMLIGDPKHPFLAKAKERSAAHGGAANASAPAGEVCVHDCFTKPASLGCLAWAPDGCEKISDKGTCLSSLDGSKVLAKNGRKVHGQPCVWCGGHPCSAARSYCEPFDFAVLDERWSGLNFQAASCKDSRRPALTTWPGIFCFALMMPTGYEPELMHEQVTRGVGIFACDGFAVFSNVTMSLGSWMGWGQAVSTVRVQGELTVPYGGKWFTALNTGVFLTVWRAVVLHGGYRHYDWTVKVDADSVFLPHRLRDRLRLPPMSSVPLLQRDPGNQCGNCTLEGRTGELCAGQIRRYEQQGSSCEDALRLTSRPWPQDCACTCGASSCQDGSLLGAMFLLNCKFGLHGPIEVLSREAVNVFIDGIDKCEAITENPWGEDKYLDHCLQLLGVQRVKQFELLNEVACGQVPVTCDTANVAFHPFKDVKGYFDCYGLATSLGKWPPEDPTGGAGEAEEPDD